MDDKGDKLIIMDTTLRDGEQSPGASMTSKEKLVVAHALRDLGVSVIEAGFPIASPGDFSSVKKVAQEVEGPIICGLARCRRKDIDAADQSLADAEKRRIHVFLATSEIHRKFKLKLGRSEIIDSVMENVAYARDMCDDVEFSPEDASRTELDFLAEVVETAIARGATTINIPDTVGYALPASYGYLFEFLRAKVTGIDGVVLSAHAHNDLGLAVANSLAAVQGGARQVECTINGIGERAGNCALEEIVMAIKIRHDSLALSTAIDTTRLYPTSRLVSRVTGVAVQQNKAIVGKNAFAHESGIHQHGMLSHHQTYEIMRPETVGVKKTSLVLGKHSGRHAFCARVSELGYHLDDGLLDDAFERFKALADKKKEIFDGDIAALIGWEISSEQEERWSFRGYRTRSFSRDPQTEAQVTLADEHGEEIDGSGIGDGLMDAVFDAIERIVGVSVRLLSYQVRSVTEDRSAQAEAFLEIETKDNSIMRGRGVSTDVIEAGARAFLSIVNRISG